MAASREDLRKLILAMNPDAQNIEEAAAAAPRVPGAAKAFGRGFYEANVAPLLSPYETAMAIFGAGKEMARAPVETTKSMARSELERLQQAGRSPEAAAGYLGGMLSPFSLFRQLPARREITAYHGSPTQFEPTAESMLGEFDVTKAGRGVGQQNRGPGTYIAENPKVANRYRIATGSADPKKGFMYTVDLPDPMIEKMIDLDAPIVNQPKIRETLLKIADDNVLPPESASYLRYMLTNPDRELQKYPLTGQGLIAVPRELGGIFKDVTEANTILQQYGIPGSRWKDDVSRGPNKGTRNFVVFPGEEKKVKILEREGPRGERTTAAPVGRTPQAPPVYHVTHTKYLPNIKKKGLLPIQTSNWVKASNRERYGGGDVYAFSTREDAERWAAKMDWAFNQKIGSGKISIVTVNRPENVKFDIDQNDPISQISNAGPWLKTSERIPAKNIVSAEEFTKDTAPGFFGNVIGKATDGE